MNSKIAAESKTSTTESTPEDSKRVFHLSIEAEGLTIDSIDIRRDDHGGLWCHDKPIKQQEALALYDAIAAQAGTAENDPERHERIRALLAGPEGLSDDPTAKPLRAAKLEKPINPILDTHELRYGDVLRPEIEFDNQSSEDGDGHAVKMFHFLNGMDAALEGLKFRQPGTIELLLPGYVWLMIKMADFDTATFLSEIITNSVELRKRWLVSKYMHDDEIEILLKAMHEEGHHEPMTAN